MIRWGILGPGNIAKKFVADIAYVNDAHVVAVGSRSIEKARQFAEDFHITNVHGSYNDLVRNPEVDVVYVATPHSHHYEHSMSCLENGKAVLCEKAFAVNFRQAKEMISLARKNNLFLMEGLWTKFLPHFIKLKELLHDNVTGDLRSVLINFGFRPKEPVPQRMYDPELAGGTMLDIGIYNVFMAMSVLGKPDHIEASMTRGPTGVDEQCAVLFKYDNGAMAQLFSSFSSFLATEADISGPKGRIRLTHRFYAPESTIEFYPERQDSIQLVPFDGVKEGFGYQYEAIHVGECIEKGLIESPVMTHNDSLTLMEVLDEIRLKAGIRYAAD
jgi:predicted dehydrogenase